MIKTSLLFTVLVIFTACLQKTMPISNSGSVRTNQLGYIAISDSLGARPILDPSYDEIIEFMVEYKMDANTHFIIERVELSEDLKKIIVPTVGVDDFSEFLKRRFVLKKGLSNSSGVFIIDVETDQVLEFIEKKVDI
ncbi:MAG: hypothetical protein HRT58_15880 [Crocinitomicaceae bacterium]|nr:hypothetical protein [Flavobacteriales bacterium]NQZ37149.1 hypothetical protein [Crocinitomicaceae bacterium]